MTTREITGYEALARWTSKFLRRGVTRDLHSARRGERPHRRPQRVDPACRLSGGGNLARAAKSGGKHLTPPLPAGRPAAAVASGAP
jgi:hypothetical protein